MSDLKSENMATGDHIKAVLFDLDGTLVDSAPDLTYAMNKTLITLSLATYEEKQISLWIGNGVDKLIHRALTNSNDGIANGDDFWRAKNIFYSVYEKNSGKKSSVYSGVIKQLTHLKAHKVLLACITNKNRCFTLPLLKKLNLEQYFDVVICGDDLTNKKPHPEPLLVAASQLSVLVEQCIMVGDSKSDVIAANEVPMKVFCVDYGYNQGVDLSALSINGLLSDVGELNLFVNFNNETDYLLKECG